jgi:predicted dehydrogenase
MNINTLINNIIDATKPLPVTRKDWRIGCIGAGAIMNDCHLVAYNDLGFSVSAITSLERDISEKVAKTHGIPIVYDDWQTLLNDDSLEIIDIAVPPHVQLDIIREAVKKPNIKGILAQKPVAMSLADAREIARLGEESGVKIAVNSNMRYDQSMRALKHVMDMGLLGEPIIGTIEMRAIPHWQEFLKQYNMLELFSMGIHHIDIFRYLFGDPESITAVCRTDPRSQFPHIDGITQYTYKYADGLMATSLDDVWAWPNELCEKDMYIKWRVEGLDGMALGTIGWPAHPIRQPSTMRFTCKSYPNQWIEPKWDTVWFPDAFQGTMSGLLYAIENNIEPDISALDNITTIACVEACYKSIKEERTIKLADVMA